MRSIPAALSIAAVMALTACGGSSSGGTASTNPTAPATSAAAPADQAGATAAIKTTWTTFFNSATDHQTAAQLLENGSQLRAALRVAARLQRQQKLTESAEVVGVAFASPTEATVTYNLLSHGQTLLPNATGKAVLQDGQWKVSQSTFCTLIMLGAGGTKVPGC